MSAMMNQTQGNNQTANPEIWGLMEETKMESTNMALTGQLNISRDTTKSHLIRTVGMMAMGAIDTVMGEQVWPNAETREEVVNRTPLGRMGTTQDIAAGALYLASDESSFVTGSELVIDGGMTAQ